LVTGSFNRIQKVRRKINGRGTRGKKNVEEGGRASRGGGGGAILQAVFGKELDINGEEG